jgi:hypothetical protein
MDPSTTVMVGFAPDLAGRYFADCRQAGKITNDEGVQNDFTGDPILVCSQPRQPLWKVWSSLQTLD